MSYINHYLDHILDVIKPIMKPTTITGTSKGNKSPILQTNESAVSLAAHHIAVLDAASIE